MFGIFKRKPPALKESKTGRAIYINSKNVANFSKREYAAFAEEGYRKNIIAYQAIDKTAKAVASIPWLIKDRAGTVIEKHPISPVINRPNLLQSREEFIQDVVGFFRISGNSYIERTTTGKTLHELFALRSDRMTVNPGETGFPSGYTYSISQNNKDFFEFDQRTGQCDIRHIKTFNPLDDWYGMSPIEAAAFGVDIHNESNKHNMGLLQNGGTPSGILEMPAGETLGDEEYNRLKTDIEERISGAANRGRPLIGEGGITWKSIALSPQAMDIITQKDSSARDISLALSVPPLLLNIPGDSTYSNYKEARLAFYEETVIPLAMHLVSEFNVWLAPFLNGAYIDLDLEECPPIVERRQTLWSMANESNDLTINERRELKGYDPVEHGDQIYIEASKVPLGFELDDEDESETPNEDAATAYGDKEADEDEQSEE